MTDYAISICNRVIIWNDDNHESEVYFNGEKAGYLGDELGCITTVAERAAAAGPGQSQLFVKEFIYLTYVK